MKKQTREIRALTNLAKLLEQHGGPKIDVQETASYARADQVSESSKLEGVLHSIRRPGDYLYKVCKRCNGPFGTNYQSVAYCSDACRIRQFESDTGIKWSTDKSPEERWGGEPPVVIPPDVIATMLPYAKKILESFQKLGLTEQQLKESLDRPEPEVPEQEIVEPPPPKSSSTLGHIQFEFPETSFLL